MKRTEKIEIRVSQEEKATLANLARQEGDSVSGLIRGLVDKYMALNTASVTRKLPKWQLAGLFALAVLLGHGLTLLPMHLHERGQPTEAVAFMVNGAIGGSAFGVEMRNGNIREMTLRDGEDIIMLTLAMIGAENDSQNLNVTICRLVNGIGDCQPVLDKTMPVIRKETSVLGDQSGDGNAIHIFVQEVA